MTALNAGYRRRRRGYPGSGAGAVLSDFAKSLGPLGDIDGFTLSSYEDRSGMANRVFKIKAVGKTLTMDSYLLHDGKWEQCLVFLENL